MATITVIPDHSGSEEESEAEDPFHACFNGDGSINELKRGTLKKDFIKPLLAEIFRCGWAAHTKRGKKDEVGRLAEAESIVEKMFSRVSVEIFHGRVYQDIRRVKPLRLIYPIPESLVFSPFIIDFDVHLNGQEDACKYRWSSALDASKNVIRTFLERVDTVAKLRSMVAEIFAQPTHIANEAFLTQYKPKFTDELLKKARLIQRSPYHMDGKGLNKGQYAASGEGSNQQHSVGIRYHSRDPQAWRHYIQLKWLAHRSAMELLRMR